MTKKVNVFRYEVIPESEDWWAECLLCGWVCTSNSDQRKAEMKFGRHYQSDHAGQ